MKISYNNLKNSGSIFKYLVRLFLMIFILIEIKEVPRRIIKGKRRKMDKKI